MSKFIEYLLGNIYFQFLIGASAIGAVIAGVIKKLTAKKNKQFSCHRVSNAVIISGKNKNPKLNIEYDGKKIEELKMSKFVIWNSGKDVIKQEDIVKERPLEISCKEENMEILDISKYMESEITNKFSVKKVDDTHAIIDFDYADPMDAVVVQVLHTGDVRDLGLDCKIMGGDGIKIANNLGKKKTYSKSGRNEIKTMIITFSFLVVVIVAALFVDMFWIHKTLTNIIVNVILIIAYIISYIFLLRFVLRNVYHLHIPESVRDALNYND